MPGVLGVHAYRSTVCTGIYRDVIKMSSHHSCYRDKYKSQEYHAGCQVIAR